MYLEIGDAYIWLGAHRGRTPGAGRGNWPGSWNWVEVVGGGWRWVEVGGGRWRCADLISCNLLDRVVEVSGNICICIFLIIFAKGWKWLHHLQRVCLADDQVFKMNMGIWNAMDFKSCFLNWPQLWSWQLFDLRHQGDPWRWYWGGDQGGFQGFWQRGTRLHTSAGPYRGALIKTKTTFSVMSLGEVPPFLVWYSKVMIVILLMEFWSQNIRWGVPQCRFCKSLEKNFPQTNARYDCYNKSCQVAPHAHVFYCCEDPFVFKENLGRNWWTKLTSMVTAT